MSGAGEDQALCFPLWGLAPAVVVRPGLRWGPNGPLAVALAFARSQNWELDGYLADAVIRLKNWERDGCFADAMTRLRNWKRDGCFC